MMPTLPPGVVPYRRTPTFTMGTIPQALLQAHSTKSGVWGRIVVVSGRLRYELVEGGQAFELGPGDVGIVAPGTGHRVSPIDQVRFYIEFLK